MASLKVSALATVTHLGIHLLSNTQRLSHQRFCLFLAFESSGKSLFFVDLTVYEVVQSIK